jgi:hypothetical protein
MSGGNWAALMDDHNELTFTMLTSPGSLAVFVEPLWQRNSLLC